MNVTHSLLCVYLTSNLPCNPTIMCGTVKERRTLCGSTASKDCMMISSCDCWPGNPGNDSGSICPSLPKKIFFKVFNRKN